MTAVDVGSQRGAAAPSADPHDYRCLLTVADDGEAMERILEQLACWLRPRGLEVDLAVPGLHRADGAELMVVHRDSAAGRDFRARLVETRSTGVWATELTAHLPGRDDGWLTLQVTNDQGRSVAVPRLVGYLLDVLDARDGEMPLSSQPPVVGVAGLDGLLDAVCDPDRHGLLMVAGTGDRGPFDPFLARAREWTRHVRGLAQAVVLDPHATAAFAAMIGETHAVPAWTLRSYQPEADPAWEPDARRHKILGRAAIATLDDNSIRALLARSARQQVARRPMPAAVTRVSRDLARQADRLLVDALFRPDIGSASDVPTSQTSAKSPLVDQASPGTQPPTEKHAAEQPVADQASRYLAQVELVKKILGLATVDADTLSDLAGLVARARRDATATDRVTAELAARQRRITELEDEVAFHQELLEEEEFDRVLAEDERSRAEDEARWLRQRLRDRGDYAASYEVVPADRLTRHPSSFEELLARLGELEAVGVVFTGDHSTTRALDDVDGNGKLVRACWEALLLLGDYVAARNSGHHDHNVHRYLEDTPSGYRTMSPKKHALKESESTMKQWGRERMLTVPTEVDESGYACMEAHFKLGRVGIVSPRMHYLDDVAGTGRVYVGHIGPHLTTAATN